MLLKTEVHSFLRFLFKLQLYGVKGRGSVVYTVKEQAHKRLYNKGTWDCTVKEHVTVQYSLGTWDCTIVYSKSKGTWYSILKNRNLGLYSVQCAEGNEGLLIGCTYWLAQCFSWVLVTNKTI